MPRRLPDSAETMRILARCRTRPARRPPPTAGRGLGKFIKGLEERFGQGPDVLRARWREIAGETLALRTEPVKLVKSRTGGATLELKVDGPAAALIQHQAPEVLARVNLFLGEGTVAKLRIVQGRVKPPVAALAAAEVAKARRRRAQPLDAAKEAELEEGLAKVQDGPLKRALLRLGREVLRAEDGR
ncbi:MAG: hypothetical protein JWO72_3290 [Caulobacteraceae bacterium]|nr:hypothetical protein [Caulobacteraceae bacterium]